MNKIVRNSTSTPRTPYGLVTFGKLSNFPGARKIAAMLTAIEAPAARANHRHRADGRCPSGNSRMRKIPASPISGIHVGPSSAAASGPPGSVPWRARSAYLA